MMAKPRDQNEAMVRFQEQMAKEVEKLKSSNAMKPPQPVVKAKPVQEQENIAGAPLTPQNLSKSLPVKKKTPVK